MLPTPGSRWSHPGSGGVFTVGDVDLRRGVLLLGDSGQPPVRLAPYGWPGPWVLVPGESREGDGSTERHPMRALLVGGAEGRHMLRIQDILLEMGFKLVGHVSGYGAKTLGSVPQEVEVIVFLHSHAGHPLYQDTKKTAKELGLPMLLVDSAGMREALRLERLRLKLGVWEKVGGALRAFETKERDPDGGWWTWTGSFWKRTTPASIEADERAASQENEDEVAPGTVMTSESMDDWASVGLVVAGLSALFR